MRNFRELKIWQKAHGITLEVYRVTKAFPKEELYGLTSQMRRAAASAGANIAEGCGRDGEGEFVQFLPIAVGSASELEYHLVLARDLGLLEEAGYQKLSGDVIELKRMLTSFVQKVNLRRTGT